MNTHRLLISCLLSLACLGPLTRPAQAQAHVPEMKPVHSVNIGHSVDYLEFAPDGKTFLVGNENHTVAIFDAENYTSLYKLAREGEGFYERLHSKGMGYINANTFFFTEDIYSPEGTPPSTGMWSNRDGRSYHTHLRVRSIQPAQEIFEHLFEENERIGPEPILATEDYLLSDSGLLKLKWAGRGPEQSPVGIEPTFPFRVRVSYYRQTILARSGRVMIHTDYRDHSLSST